MTLTPLLARLLSIAGHPAVLMPAAVLIAAPARVRLAALIASAACAAAVLGYSFHKAHRGDWAHIDASVPAERTQFNARVGSGLLVAAGALWLLRLPIGLPLVIGLAGLIVMTGQLFRGVAKLSLHVAFAVFATFLAWPNHGAAIVLAVMAAGVAWSRLALRRHVPADLLLGLAAGAAAGLAFHIAMARLAA